MAGVAGKRVAAKAVKAKAVAAKRVAGNPAGTVKRRSASASQARHERNKRISEQHTASLLSQLAEKGCPVPEREHRFRSDRAWKFDLVFVSSGVAVEIEGGIYRGGRHTHVSGFELDAIKYATAIAMGWVVIRVTPKMIHNGSAAIFIAETLRISGVSGIVPQVFPWENAEEG